MTSVVKFTSFFGSAGTEEPHCHLLEIDDCKILLDCGWNSHFDTKLFEKVGEIASSLDLIVISHPDMLHIGGLVYFVKTFETSAKILCTTPIYQMGQKCMYDAYESKRNEQDFDLFNLDDVDRVFRNCVQLRHSQTFRFETKGISVTPNPSGHTVGGSFWIIAKETEEIIYAVDFNHKKER